MKHILQLMACPSVSGLKLGGEDKISIAFANRLRAWTLEGKLIAVWTHLANEVAGGTKNAKIRYAIARALGMISGASDYVFLWDGGSAAIEFKFGRNSQTEKQIQFQHWCELKGVPYFVVKSADEGEAKLKELGILKL